MYQQTRKFRFLTFVLSLSCSCGAFLLEKQDPCVVCEPLNTRTCKVESTFQHVVGVECLNNTTTQMSLY